MKKSLFFVAAASALMLTACSSESDVLQSTTQPQQTVVNRAVGFDIYTPAATNVTRAGLTGTMTTNRLQLEQAQGGGFGVYAYLTEDTNTGAGDANATGYSPAAGQDPNFMVNEMVLWNATNQGWYYDPLKYWPNETDNDSQNTAATMIGTDRHLDRLTFFAYAPYVSAGAAAPGITAISDNDGKLNSTVVKDPTIAYEAAASNNLDAGVDLLWGVAPAGGLSYTAVNGRTVTKNAGMPLIDMVKPDVNTNMKFLFEHALARIGVTVVAAIDQVAPGGTLDPNTKITINSLTLKGKFGTTGELNLNNGNKAHVANWTKIQGDAITNTSDAISTTQTLTLTKDGGGIAPHLQYAGDHTFGSYSAQNVVGVTTTKQDLITPSTVWFNKKAGASTPYNPGKKYFSNAAGTVEAHASYTVQSSDNIYTYGSSKYTHFSGSISAPDYPGIETATSYYALEDDECIPTGTASAPYAPISLYTKNGEGVYSYVESATWPNTENYYTVKATKLNLSDIDFAYSGDIYEAERNFFMVVPTNGLLNSNFGNVVAESDEDKALRTIQVQIEYYITTEDSKIDGGRTQTKNVITKDVLFPSLANGKSYNLNIVLGLTSVKMEAEVDDWKVINVNADLPQNTAE